MNEKEMDNLPDSAIGKRFRLIKKSTLSSYDVGDIVTLFDFDIKDPRDPNERMAVVTRDFENRDREWEYVYVGDEYEEVIE